MRRIILASAIVTMLLVSILVVAKLISDRPFGAGWAGVVVALMLYTAHSFAAVVWYHRYRVLSKIWLAILVSGVTCLVADTTAGWILLPRVEIPGKMDKYLHHRYLPNTQGSVEGPEFTFSFTINNFGLRGGNVSQDKTPGVYRILTIGDSFTAGWGVDDSECFSAVLERYLNAITHREHAQVVEVLNGGVHSYCPILYQIAFKRYLGRFNADLVILNFDMSDLLEEELYRQEAIRSADGEIIGIDGVGEQSQCDRLLAGIRDWISQHLYVTRTLMYKLDRFRIERRIANIVNTGEPDWLAHTLLEDKEDRSDQWNNIFESILMLKQQCDCQGAEFVLVVYPWGHQVNDKEWIPGRYFFNVNPGTRISDRSIERLRDFAERNNIHWLNTFPAFRAYHGSELLYFHNDLHWTRDGHRIMAKTLEQFLRQQHFWEVEGIPSE